MRRQNAPLLVVGSRADKGWAVKRALRSSFNVWCGRAVSRAVYRHVITKFSRMGGLLHFLTHYAQLALFARELR